MTGMPVETGFTSCIVKIKKLDGHYASPYMPWQTGTTVKIKHVPDQSLTVTVTVWLEYRLVSGQLDYLITGNAWRQADKIFGLLEREI